MSGLVSFDAAWERIDQVFGWLSPGQERALFDLAESTPESAVILELGCFLGRSTASMASACIGTRKKVFVIDTFAGNSTDFIKGENGIDWEGDSFLPTFRQNMHEAEVTDYVVPLKGMTTELAKHWCAPLDMLFIDAGHDLKSVSADYDLYYPHLKRGGLLALHDVTEGWPDVYEFWNDTVAPELEGVGKSGSLSWGTVR